MNAAEHSWPAVLGSLLRDGTLDRAGAAWAMEEIMTGAATPAQTAGFAVALRSSGETAEAVLGLVETMLAHAPRTDHSGDCVDIVGTGGDQAFTVNLSTMSAIVAAGSGVPVAKHGNRAASSKCGSADVLEELGVKLALDAAGVVRCIDEVGIGFFFAPQFHSGLRFAATARKDLGIPTVFNFLGPLSNPARPRAMAVGCADPRMAPILADVMRMREVSALVFRGDDGLDELTTTTTSQVWLVPPGADEVVTTSLDPVRLGISAASPEDLRGGEPPYNAQVARELFDGKPGPVREAVLLNSAAAIVAYRGVPQQPSQVEDAIVEGIQQAAESIDSGAAARTLTQWIDVSNAA